MIQNYSLTIYPAAPFFSMPKIRRKPDEVDEEAGKVKIYRPSKEQEAVSVTLTAKLTIKESKDVFVEKEKNFELTILPSNVEIVEKQEAPLFEDFSSYSTGEEIGEYLKKFPKIAFATKTT